MKFKIKCKLEANCLYSFTKFSLFVFMCSYFIKPYYISNRRKSRVWALFCCRHIRLRTNHRLASWNNIVDLVSLKKVCFHFCIFDHISRWGTHVSLMNFASENFLFINKTYKKFSQKEEEEDNIQGGTKSNSV